MDSSSDNRVVLREEEPEPSAQQPRQPRNMEGLLRYAIEAMDSRSTSESTPDLGPLDPERREFLNNVFSSMTVDIVEEMSKALEILRQDYKLGDSSNKFEEAFENLFELVVNIDTANDYIKLGGFDVCSRWLEEGPDEVRWRAADIVAECSQNNVLGQTKATERGLLRLLMELNLNSSHDMVRLKSFHAISCIVRNNKATLLSFLSNNGHRLILRCLQSSNRKLQTKAAFFTSAIASQEGMLKDQLWDIGLVGELVRLVGSSSETGMVEDVACFEQCLSALLCLLTDTKNKLKDVKSVSDNLSQLKQNLQDDPPYIESVDYIISILKVINPSAIS